MGYVLLTNDDGVESPALAPLARALGEQAPVRIVVPDGERSWISKAISRWEEVSARELSVDGLDVTSIGGSPADCTNLAVHSLFDSPPDMVVSGVNIGLNAGLGYFLSSGTVGAAMEGWIAGLPALAFSVGVPDNDRRWKERIKNGDYGDLWPRAAALVADIVRTVRECGFPANVDLLNVNFPVDADVRTPRVITGLAGIGYQRLFRMRSDGLFVHDSADPIQRSGDRSSLIG